MPERTYPDLQNGLYEQVINKSINADLAATDKLYQTELIDPAEAADVLSRYIAEVAEKGFAAACRNQLGFDNQAW